MCRYGAKKKIFFNTFRSFSQLECSHPRGYVSLDALTLLRSLFLYFWSFSCFLRLCMCVCLYFILYITEVLRGVFEFESSEKNKLDKIVKWKSPVYAFTQSLLFCFSLTLFATFVGIQCVYVSKAMRFGISRG